MEGEADRACDAHRLRIRGERLRGMLQRRAFEREILSRRRLGARRASRPPRRRPRLGGHGGDAGDAGRLGLPSRSVATSPCSCIPRHGRNTRLRAPNASMAAATGDSNSSSRPTSRSRRTSRAATSRSTRWRAMREGALIDPFGGAADLRAGVLAPRVAGVRRGSAARAARRALRRAFRLRGGAGDGAADAQAGQVRRARGARRRSASGRSSRAD